MEKMLKAYWGYRPIRAYWVLFLSVLTYIFGTGLVMENFHLIFVPILLTPIYEWLVHKYFLHIQIPKSWGVIHQYMRRSHYDHHEDPQHPVLVFAQPTLSIFLLVKFYVIFGFIYGWKAGLVPWSSVCGIYLFYEWTHLGHHMNGYDHQTRFGKMMRKAHQWHHYKNPNYWWGITSPFADYILRTFPDPKDVEASVDEAKNINS